VVAAGVVKGKVLLRAALVAVVGRGGGEGGEVCIGGVLQVGWRGLVHLLFDRAFAVVAGCWAELAVAKAWSWGGVALHGWLWHALHVCLLVVGLELHLHVVGGLLEKGEVEELLVEAIAQEE
jgi:hypothetical protein